MKKRKLRMGMIGGGKNGFIGSVHLRAALMENQINLVCGCFSSDPLLSIESGREYFIPDNRIYSSYQEMIEKESKLPKEERMDFVTIVTPNKLHFEPAMLALKNGFHVVIDKPMTFSLDEAKKLQKLVEETNLILALTHVYSGYPAAKELRARVSNGSLGKIRRVYVEYLQGWLSHPIELEGNNNAVWRTDPNETGKAGCIGDIGTHAWHLCEYVLESKVTKLSAELTSFVPNRPVDDDGVAFLHFENGAKGVLTASQIAIGEENNLRIRIYGDKGALEWEQQQPNTIKAKWSNKPTELIRIGNYKSYLDGTTKHNIRIPSGHPEGLIEAFSNIYKNFSLTIQSRLCGKEPKKEYLDFPTVYDGVRGMQFIETMVASGYDNQNKWQEWIE